MTKRKDGLWQEAVTINGKRKYFYGKTKAEVLRKINEYKEKEEVGKTFEEVAKLWDSEHEKEVSPTSHYFYNVSYKVAVEKFQKMPIKEITPQQIDRFIKEIATKRYAKRTVQGYLTLLSLIFKFAIKNGFCNNNPTDYISVPSRLKVTHRELPPESDIKIIKNSVDCTFGLFAYFLLYTGCRRGEALAVTYDDINFQNKTISINKAVYFDTSGHAVLKDTKTEAGNRIIILLDALANKLNGKGYVFGGDKLLSQNQFNKLWKEYKKESGIQSTPHQLRHLFATILYENGIDEFVAKELMGHSSISVTRNIYTHIREKKFKETAEILNKNM